ncbi:hypothetical protein L596_010853 [Steinernema carpocapsae]|uniref:Secreted protein n=1 Tax=Steinernema carpocapsae TaxID=34508 RepID=A0A4U5PK57_STECR|nr:hypothetical protein L596_010853 [Steinernema carpocapsae]
METWACFMASWMSAVINVITSGHSAQFSCWFVRENVVVFVKAMHTCNGKEVSKKEIWNQPNNEKMNDSYTWTNGYIEHRRDDCIALEKKFK